MISSHNRKQSHPRSELEIEPCYLHCHRRHRPLTKLFIFVWDCECLICAAPVQHPGFEWPTVAVGNHLSVGGRDWANWRPRIGGKKLYVSAA